MLTVLSLVSAAPAATKAAKRECRLPPAPLIKSLAASMRNNGYPASDVTFLTKAVSTRVTNAFSGVALNDWGKECGPTGIQRVLIGCMLEVYPGVLAEFKDPSDVRPNPTLKRYGKNSYSAREVAVLAMLEGCIGHAKVVFAR